MYVIQCRIIKDGNAGEWFPVFSGFDGADAADFLRRLVETEVLLKGLAAKEVREYNLLWVPSGDPRLSGPGRTEQPAPRSSTSEPMCNFDDLERGTGDEE